LRVSLLDEVDRTGSRSAVTDFTAAGSHPVWGPLLAAEYELATAAGDVAIEPGARDELLALLARRWSAVVHAAIGGQEHEPGQERGLAHEPAHAPLDNRSALARLLRALPELDGLLTLVREQWRASVLELWARLGRDRVQLSAVFFGGAPLARVVGLEAGLSDPHGGGRSVVIVTFEGGRRVVYKPRDLRAAEWFMQLCVRLSEWLPLPLHARAILTRDGYGWESWIERAPCADESEVRRYYARAGSLLRLLELLGGADFHRENVLASGEHPVLLDLETVLDALPPPPPGAISAEQRVFELRKQSPLRVGLLPEWASRGTAPGAAPFDHGGLAVAPVLEGAPVQRSRYVHEVVDGYTRTASALSEERARAVLEAALSEAGDIPLRYVHRPTPVYLQLLRDSLAPARLAAAGEREAFLRDRLGDGPLARAELAALLHLDVPLLRCTLDGAGVRELGGGDEVAWLERERSAAVLSRAARLADPDLIVSAFAAGPLRVAPDLPPHAAQEPARDELVRAAVAIGDIVLDAAIEAAGPALAWLGLRTDPQSGLRAVERLPPDVLSGTSGIAIVLARLYAVTREPRFAQAARRALQPSLRRLEAHTAQPEAGPAAWAFEIGVLHGPGSWLYAAEQCATHLGQPDLRAERVSYVLAGSAAPLAAAPGDPLAALERCVEAMERAADPASEGAALQLAARFIERRRAQGSWLGPEGGADRHNLSAVTGVCALADLFLRIAEQVRFGSIRIGR
jgi:hypothetical protein